MQVKHSVDEEQKSYLYCSYSYSCAIASMCNAIVLQVMFVENGMESSA